MGDLIFLIVVLFVFAVVSILHISLSLSELRRNKDRRRTNEKFMSMLYSGEFDDGVWVWWLMPGVGFIVTKPKDELYPTEKEFVCYGVSSFGNKIYSSYEGVSKGLLNDIIDIYSEEDTNHD